MPDQLGAVLTGTDAQLSAYIAQILDGHASRASGRLERLWAYFRNPLELVGRGVDASASGWYRLAQEQGLPARVTGRRLGAPGTEHARREVVIENDIGWRISAMVDFMIGEPVRIRSLAGDEDTRMLVEAVLERVWERSGGVVLMQDVATLGHVYGHVDLLLRVDESMLFTRSLDDIHDAFSVEPIEPRRGVPIVSEDDYRELEGYVIRHGSASAAPEQSAGRVERWTDKIRRRGSGGSASPGVDAELITADGHKRVSGDGVVTHAYRSVLLGEVPVVHIQNVSQPFEYSGLGEVEPLVPLQDELNTRLSDRANRVTLQSFKMYLARGIEGFDGSAVSPGTVWSTDNPDASISAFGGDASSPSEDRHIDEIREAMDKVSGVPPLAGGVVKARIGNLSSANALRVTLMGLISKTRRKRVTYGRGFERVSTMVLTALDEAGVLRTSEADRKVSVEWGALGPIDSGEALDEARAKIEIGADRSGVIEELGLDSSDPGVV